VVAPIRRTPRASSSAQIIGPLYEDDTALTFELLAQVLGGYAPPRI
jgi:hypothetical protein